MNRFISFVVFGYPDESLALVLEIVLAKQVRLKMALKSSDSH